MKKFTKKLIPFLLLFALFITVTPIGSASDSNYGISVCGDEEEEIDIGILTRN